MDAQLTAVEVTYRRFIVHLSTCKTCHMIGVTCRSGVRLRKAHRSAKSKALQCQ